MAEIINFTAVLNTRRAAAESAARDAAKEARYNALQSDIANKLGGTAGAHIIAEAVTDLKRQDDATRFVPAYYLPSNEVRGAKYDATARLSLPEIAKRMRQDIKDAIAAGTLPKGLKVSIRSEYYSGGGAIRMSVTALPAGHKMHSDEYIQLRRDYPAHDHRHDFFGDRYTPEHTAIMNALKAIHGAYNRDNSDSMTDYFDRNYYGDASVHYELRHAFEQAELPQA